MKHQITAADFVTDLTVTGIVLGATIAIGIVGFMFAFMIAPI